MLKIIVFESDYDFKKTGFELMELIEKIGEWKANYELWHANDGLRGYGFVENTYAPFTAARRALPMLNLGLVSSAGAYIDGTDPFDIGSADGDASFKEIPIEVDADDIRFAARGYDPTAVRSDINSQIPIDRLLGYQENGVIGKLNSTWWSFNGFIPNATLVAEQTAPKITERVVKQEVQAVLIIPASRLCHQSCGIVARAIEQAGIPTIMIAVERQVPDMVRPPRTAFYDGDFGCVAGKPNWMQHQLRILDESLRWIETLDQPTVRKLVVELETQVEAARGER